MSFKLMELPFEKNALEPLMSSETIDYHYGKHHQTYVNNLNNLIVNTEYENMSLEEIIKSASGGVFNNAAQVFNHDFFWNCLTPTQKIMSYELEEILNKTFGDLEAFQQEFTQKAISHFGSGWAWLVQDNEGKLSIISTSNANTPISQGLKPLLTCDVWEHAYYIDTRNARPQYLENYWKLVNWDFVAKQL